MKHLASLFSRYRSTKKASTVWALVGFSRPLIFLVSRCRSFSEGANDGAYNGALSPSYIDNFVSSSEGLRLAQAFMRIERPALRLRIVKLVQEIVGDDGD